ncbi:MAG: carboxypeptidase-like regulatory domain-containing protein, partial [Planctomycetes bacterium]|nr:carboxypeptidase-like regulatory domain-containing protein [Planctomycetota bacterium]
MVRYGGLRYTRRDGYSLYYYEPYLVWATGETDLTIQDTLVEYAYGDAVYMDSGNVYIECCTCNEYGNAAVHITGTAIATVRRNNFEDTQDDYGVKNDRTVWVDARLSWWGDMSGPGPVGPGTGAKVSGYVLYNPWTSAPVDCDGGGPSGPGTLSGVVYDAVTGGAVVGATVTIPGQDPTQTGSQGEYSFADLPIGNKTIQVVNSGYYDASKTVYVSGESGTISNFVLIPEAGGTDPAVAEVRGAFFGPDQRTYYLDGIFLDETITATIDWKGYTPDYVRWITPYATYDDDCTGSTVTHEFNMGAEFGESGTLTVLAVAADGTNSAPYEANFKVIPVPPGILMDLLYPVPLGSTLKYTTPQINVDPTGFDEGVEQGLIPDDMPLFGREAFEFASNFDFSAEVTGDGQASGITISPQLPSEEKKTKLAGFEFGPQISGQATWTFYENPDRWVPGGHIDIGATVGADIPPVPIVFFFGPIPCYFRGHIDVGVSVGLDIQSWAEPGEAIFDGTLNLSPFPYAEAMLGAGAADVLAVEGYLGGGASMTLNYPYVPPEPVLEALQIYLAGGVRVVVFIFSWDWPLLEYTWDVYGGKFRPMDPGPGMLRLMPRDYLKRGGGYAVWVANDRDLKRWRDAVTVEEPLQLNVFGQATPHLAAVGNDLLLGWVYDDPTRTPVNRTEVVFSGYDADAEEWSEYAPVVDDGTADFHPQIATWASGDALLAWENVSEVLVEPGEPNDPCLTSCETECQDPNSPECQQCLASC